MDWLVSFKWLQDNTLFFYLVVIHVVLALASLLTITYTIRVTNNTLVIRKQFFWLTYWRVSSKFNEITFDEKGINFTRPSSILRLEAYEGDGYDWGDLPDCFLVSWEEKEVVLGDKSDLQAFRSLLKDPLKDSGYQ